MGRTIAAIQAQMDDQQALQPALSGLNSPSQTAIYTLWKFIMSFSIFFSESLWDLLKSEIEETIATQAVGSNSWLKKRVDEFQYSITVSQILQIVNDVPSYNPIDTTLQIISRSSVTTSDNKVVSVKVATGEPPVALDTPQKASLEGYLDLISFAGVKPSVISLASDKLFLEAEIFYNGQFATTIEADVIAGIETYLKELDFDSNKPSGKVRVEKLTDAIQGVTGVTDLVITNLGMRANTVAFGSKVLLVNAKTTVFRQLATAAGYIVQEDTSGETFTDRLTFTTDS